MRVITAGLIFATVSQIRDTVYSTFWYSKTSVIAVSLLPCLSVVYRSAKSPPISVIILAFAHCQVFGAELDDYLVVNDIELSDTYPKAMREVPETLEVITRRDVDNWGASILGEALEHIVGIHIRKSSEGTTGRVMIRGIDSNWILLRNGVLVDKALRDVTAIPLNDIQRIEILKGSHFAVYGANTISGTINLIYKDATDSSTSAGGSWGTFQSSELWAKRTGSIGAIDYTAHVTSYNSDGSDPVIERDRQSEYDDILHTNISFAPGPAALDISLQEIQFGLEKTGHFLWRNYLSHRKKGSGVGLFQALDPQGKETVLTYTSEFKHNVKSFKRPVELAMIYTYATGSYDNMMLLPPGTLGGLFPDGLIQSYGLSGHDLLMEASSVAKTNVHTTRFSLGAKYIGTRSKYDERNYTVSGGFPTPQPLEQITSFPLEESIFGDYNEKNVFGVLRDRWALSNDVTLDLGVRADYSSLFGWAVNPRINMLWKMNRSTDVVLLYGESTQTPTTVEIASNGLFVAKGNPDIEYSKMRMGEVSIRRKFAPDYHFYVNAYRYHQSDIIGTVSDDTSPNGLAFANLDSGLSGKGLEFVFSKSFKSGTDIKLGWAYEDNTSQDIGSQKKARNQPYAELNHAFPERLNLNITYYGIWDRERADGDDRANMDDYNIVNVAINKRLRYNDARIYFQVSNLFDDDAREDISKDIPLDFPINERSARLGIDMKW